VSYNMNTNQILAALGFALTTLATGNAQAYAISFGEWPSGSNSTVPTVAQLANSPEGTARGDFFANFVAPNVHTETFEGIAANTAGNLSNLSFGGSNSNFTATVSSTAGKVLAAPDNTGRYGNPADTSTPTTNSHFWAVDLSDGGFTVTFSKAVAAFGFFGTDIGDQPFNLGEFGLLSLDVYNGANLLQNLAVNNVTGSTANGSALYFGFVADNSDQLFTSITFRTSLTNKNIDTMGFDDFTVADAGQAGIVVPTVPEPGTIALVGAALLGAGLARRRRRA
jgi:hypothetical protein